jgi:PKD repeat protein
MITISGNSSFGGIGGFVGRLYNNSSTAYTENCSSSCDIDGGSVVNQYIGGFLGYSLSYSSHSFDITNCHATGNIQSNCDYVGGFAGYCGCRTDNCYAEGDIVGANIIGGFNGYFAPTGSNRDIQDCYSTGDVSGLQYAGGFIGVSPFQGYYASITNCYATGNVNADLGYAGGLIGYCQYDLINCYATGDVNAQGNYAGGLIGFHGFYPLSDCHASGDVNSSGSNAGGLIGLYESNFIPYPPGPPIFSGCYATGNVNADLGYAGGLIGVYISLNQELTECSASGNVSGSSNIGGFFGKGAPGSNVVISKCLAIGNVTVTSSSSSSVGGFAGKLDNWVQVENCYAQGDVVSTAATQDRVGGFVGHYVSTIVTYIKYCYSSGLVSVQTGSVGGFCGYSDDSIDRITDCYWDVETSGQSTSVGGGVGKTTAEMKTEANFVSWDFSTIWAIIENETYPQFVVSFFSAAPLSGSSPLSVQFTDMSVGGPTSWDWDFGDGSPHSTDQNPLHVYTSNGIYTVTLFVRNTGLIDTYSIIDYITVSGQQIADFYGYPTLGYVSLTVSFFDISTISVDSRYWDFGDGYSSDEQNPVHQYLHPGFYTVSLTITNSEGETTVSKDQYISVLNVATYDIAPLPKLKAFLWGSGLAKKRDVGIEIRRIDR